MSVTVKIRRPSLIRCCLTALAGFLIFHVMSNNSETQNQQALKALQSVLSYQEAKEYQSDLIHLFTGYLESDRPHCDKERKHLAYVMNVFYHFFETLKTLPKIDRFRA